MSFNLSGLMPRNELNPAITPQFTNDESVIYSRNKQRLCTRIERQLVSVGVLPFTVRVGFLTDPDKSALINGLEEKGYAVVENDGRITIS